MTRRWSSMDDECVPKGFCGVNSFCIQMDNAPQCQCLPGFVSVRSGNYRAGCLRAFSGQGCPKTDDMKNVENTEWEDNSYENMFMSEEECSKACLDDCNCEAAFFKDNQCQKQKLPLRFGTRSMGNSSMAIVRVSTTTVPDIGGRSDGKRIPDNGGHSGGKRIIKKRKKGRVDILIIGIVLMSVGVLALAISAIFAFKKQKDQNKINKDDGGEESGEDGEDS